MNQNKSQDN